MGTNAVISVIGFIVVFSLITTTLNRRNTESYDNSYSYMKYTTARDIALNSIQITLRKIDTATTITSSYFPVSGSLDAGSFVVDGTIINDSTLRLSSKSTYADTAYRIKTTLARKQISLPPPLFDAAFGIYPDNVNITFNPSKDSIDGRDHDINGHLLATSPDSVPPIMVRTVTDSTNAAIAIAPGNTVIGTPKIKVDAGMSNPNAVGDQFKLIADSIWYSPAGNTKNIGNGGNVLGDSNHPIIVFLDGTNTSTGVTNGSFFLKIKDGYGILVCKGNLKFAGGATWHGAVIVFGDTALTLSASSGNSQVYGSILFGGSDGGTFALAGNSVFFHSRVALDLFKKMKNPYLYQIVDWYE